MNHSAKKSSAAVRVTALIVRIYQLTLSPLLHAIFGPGSGCRFHPSCSCYARDALFTHGFFAGSRLAVRRIFRCHPWSAGGYDPVPDLKTKHKQDIAPPFKTHSNG